MRSISEGLWKTAWDVAGKPLLGNLGMTGAMIGAQIGAEKYMGNKAEASEPQTPVVVNHNYIQPETEKPPPPAAGSLASAINHPDGLKYAAGAGLAGAAALGTMAALRNRKQKEQEKKNAIT